MPHECQREQRRGAHGIDVRKRVRRGDRAKVERIVDDRHEKVGRRDDGLHFVDPVDRGVVRGLDADEKLFRHDPGHRLGNDLLQCRGRDLAAAAAAVAELGKAERGAIRGVHFESVEGWAHSVLG